MPGRACRCASMAVSWRCSRASNACRRISGHIQSTASIGRASKRSKFGNGFKIGADRRAAKQRDRKIAEAGILAKRSEERIDHRRTVAFADENAVELARVEIACGAFDAERADQADAFADDSCKFGIGPAASGDKHSRIVERIAAGRRGNSAPAARTGFAAAEYGGVQACARVVAEASRAAMRSGVAPAEIGKGVGRDRHEAGRDARQSPGDRVLAEASAPRRSRGESRADAARSPDHRK